MTVSHNALIDTDFDIASHKDQSPDGTQTGILILKKIPKGAAGSTKSNGNNHHDAPISHFEHASAPETPTVPPFKSLPDSAPSGIPPPPLPILPTGDAHTQSYSGQGHDQLSGHHLTPPATSYGVPLNSVPSQDFANANLGIDSAYQNIINGLNPQKVNDLPNIETFPPFPGQLPPQFVAQHGLSNINYNPDPKHQFLYDTLEHLDSLKSASAVRPSLSPRPSKMSPQAVRELIKNVPVGTLFSEVMSKMKSQRSKRKPKPKPHSSRTRKLPLSLIMDDTASGDVNVVKSVGYELGPHGPVRIH